MNLMVLDTKLNSTLVIDEYESLIWTERYNEYGDFEMCLPINSAKILNTLKLDYYVCFDESDLVMIIESIKIETDEENGDKLIVSGRSLESILCRRIIWNQTKINGNLQNGIKTLLNKNVISPQNTERKIDGFIFSNSSDPAITALKINTQFTGDNLYTAIKSICESKNIGFKVTISDKNFFVFQLYSGVDRSYSQSKNSYVVISQQFDNLISSSYSKSQKDFRNVTLIMGEGQGKDRVRTTVDITSSGATGLNRRELYTDAKDISSEEDDGKKLSLEEYTSLLEERGIQKLSENLNTESFECHSDNAGTFKYGLDYFIGDVIQIENEYGIKAKARVTEHICTIDSSGRQEYPTFITFK